MQVFSPHNESARLTVPSLAATHIRQVISLLFILSDLGAEMNLSIMKAVLTRGMPYAKI